MAQGGEASPRSAPSTCAEGVSADGAQPSVPTDSPGGQGAPGTVEGLQISEVPSGSEVQNAPLPKAPDSETTKTNQSRKEESPFSFKHFLKRDLSLPATASSYESTGAKPKTFNEYRPSPAKTNVHQGHRRDNKVRESWAGPSNASSDSSIELIVNTNNSSDSKSNILEIEDCDLSSFRRSHTSNDALGMPSLPDFVQDHLLVEQTYLGSNGPFATDFNNLPDFTTNFNFNYDDPDSVASNANSSKIGSCRSVPLDLPSFVEDRLEINEISERRCRPSPLDLPNNLSLDLTDSLNHTNHRDSNQRLQFPLDLPRNENPTVSEPLRLPDFLPTQAGACSGSSGIISSNASDLAEEQMRRVAVERELRSALQTATQLRRELKAVKSSEENVRRELLEARSNNAILAHRLNKMGRLNQKVQKGSGSGSGPSTSTSHSPTLSEDEKNYSVTFANEKIIRLTTQNSSLKEELAAAHREIEELRGGRRGVAESLHLAANSAENSLRELLTGLEQLRGLASSLDPP